MNNFIVLITLNYIKNFFKKKDNTIPAVISILSIAISVFSLIMVLSVMKGFEVKVKKDIILHDQNKDLLKQENKVVSVDGVNGSELVLGSMTEVSTSGNWPTIFDAKKK